MKFTVEGDGGRLDRYLVGHLEGVSRALVMKYLKEGRARVNGHRARPGAFVKEGDAIDLPGFDEAVERIRDAAVDQRVAPSFWMRTAASEIGTPSTSTSVSETSTLE